MLRPAPYLSQKSGFEDIAIDHRHGRAFCLIEAMEDFDGFLRGLQARVVAGRVMTSADLERLRRELRDFDPIDFISDEMRAVIEDEWPELVHKLPPAKPR
jgi:hypothetical protein